VVLAGLYSALRKTGSALKDQRILCLGAGEAATGICDLVVSSLAQDGIAVEDARKRCWLFDSKGLVVASRTDLVAHKRHYAHEGPRVGEFVAAVETLKPTAIIGVAAVGGTFTQPVIEAMTRANPRPIVFALSNPTSKSECTAEQAYQWSQGRALFACGSPFDPVTLDGRVFVPRQGNNSYIFPGVGLGVIASKARRVTDEMFLAAARSLADQTTQSDLDQGSLYPPLARVREVSAHIGAAVAEVAYARGLTSRRKPKNVLADVRAQMYDPAYPRYA
jgi:malate dehydrogenase (oxaloacetate-decarboxylating)(NADP+)